MASALAGGDFIDDADVLRTGGTAGAIGCVVKRHPPWNFPAQLPVGPRPPVGSGEPGVAVPAWAAGTGPGEGPLTIDLDSTICETYGLAKEGAVTMVTLASGAITRCWPSPPAPERC